MLWPVLGGFLLLGCHPADGPGLHPLADGAADAADIAADVSPSTCADVLAWDGGSPAAACAQLMDDLAARCTPGPRDAPGSTACAQACVPDVGNPPGYGALASCLQQCNGAVASGQWPSLQACVDVTCAAPEWSCLASGATGDGSCAAADACRKACLLQGKSPFQCRSTCLAQMSAAAQAAWSAWKTCQEFSTVASCLWPELDCLAAQPGTQPCRTFLPCLQACPDDVPASKPGASCLQGCYGALDSDARLLVRQLGADWLTWPGTWDDAAAVACMAPTGAGTCAEVLACALPNASSPSAAVYAPYLCLHDVEAKPARIALNLLRDCLTAPDFATAGCRAGYLACVPPQGTAGCAATATCLHGCLTAAGPTPAQEPACLSACLGAASPEAAGKALATLWCAPTAAGPDSSGCVDAMAACAPPAGSTTCAGTVACIEACEAAHGLAADRLGCALTCAAQASPGSAWPEAWTCKAGCEVSCAASTDASCVPACMQKGCPAVQAKCLPAP